MTSRRKRIAAGIAVGVPLVAGALAWWSWLPALAKSRAEDALERRLGLTSHVGGASMRPSGVVLENIALEDASGGLAMQIGEVDVTLRLWETLTRAAPSIEGVEVRGLEATLDLGRDGVTESIGRVREGSSSSDASTAHDDDGPSAEVTVDRTLRLVDGRFAIRDADGPLVAATIDEASMVGSRATARVGELDIGGEGFDTLHLDQVQVAVGRGEGIVLEGFRAGSGKAIWARSSEENAHPATLDRLLALRDALRGGAVEEPPPDEGQADRGVFARLSADAKIELAGLSIETTTESGSETILDSFSTSIERTGPETLHARGEGAVGADGSLGWDLALEPLALRAQGSVSFAELPLALVTPVLSDVPWYEPEQGRLFGSLHIESGGPDRVELEGRVAVRDAAFLSSRIAPEPIRHIDVEVAGRGTFHPPSRRLEIAEGRLAMGDAEVTMNGELVWTPERYLVELTAVLPPTSCDAAVHAIPADLLGPLAGFSFQGMIGGRIAARVDSDALADTTLDIDVRNACVFETVPAMADLSHLSGPFTHRVLEPDGTWFEMTTGPGTGVWASLYETSPYLVHAVLAHEDSAFFGHSGFARWAIRDALVKNLEQRRFAVGASTITMQLAKNLFLHREKYLARKVQEVLLTWWLESALDKARILELYLNVIEYGPGIYGIQQASEHYFGRDAEELSLAESAFLACILPNPKLYHQQYERNELSTSLKSRMRHLMTHMAARGRIDEAALTQGLADVDAIRFRHEGDPLPPPRILTGRATPLPFGLPEMWGDPSEWMSDDDEGRPDDADEGWVDEPL